MAAPVVSLVAPFAAGWVFLAGFIFRWPPGTLRRATFGTGTTYERPVPGVAYGAKHTLQPIGGVKRMLVQPQTRCGGLMVLRMGSTRLVRFAAPWLFLAFASVAGCDCGGDDDTSPSPTSANSSTGAGGEPLRAR